MIMNLAIMAISLTQGLYALVDGEDYDWLNQWKWHAVYRPATKDYVAARNSKSGKRKLLLMHREIIKAPADKQVDHINHCGLDNRKTSLRTCTAIQNNQNRIPYQNVSSKYKGVAWHKHTKKWQASIQINRKHQYIGVFNDEINAAKAYDKKAIELFGEFARTNF